jgi:hypothetical protein
VPPSMVIGEQQELCIAPWYAWTLPSIVGWFGTDRRPCS